MSELFDQKIRELGLIPSTIIKDGSRQSCKVDNSKNKRSGSYFFDPNTNFGKIINWSTGEQFTHFSHLGNASSNKTTRDLSAEISKANKIREEKYLLVAQEIKQRLTKYNDSQINEAPYFVNKQIIKSVANEGFLYNPKNKTIIVPLQDSKNNIWSAQVIHPNGFKQLVKNSRCKGMYFSLGNVQEAKNIHLSEGIATTLSIRDAINEKDHAFVCTFSMNQAKNVVQEISHLLRDKNIYLYPDQSINSEVFFATSIDEKHKDQTFINIPTGLDNGGDFNDFKVKYGIESLKKQISTGSIPLKDYQIPEKIKDKKPSISRGRN